MAYSRIAPELSSYMGGVFEEICKQYLWKLLIEGKCAVNFSDIGRWWGASIYFSLNLHSAGIKFCRRQRKIIKRS